jgi:hypothetical protein
VLHTSPELGIRTRTYCRGATLRASIWPIPIGEPRSISGANRRCRIRKAAFVVRRTQAYPTSTQRVAA